MITNLRNLTVIVTGASSGIGLATATHLARAGAAVILGARSEDKIRDLSEELISLGAREAVAIPLDVTSPRSIEAFVNQVDIRFPQVDVLINNAGLARSLDPLWEGSPDEWSEMIETNVTGLLRMTRSFLPAMVKRNAGHIISLGSTAGHASYAGGAVYCATKSAVAAISDSLRKDLHGTRVRVSSVDPGAVQTNFSLVRFKGDSVRADQVYENIEPLTADDVAEMILFCITRPARVNINYIIATATDQQSPL
jgi:3-hydroxy acid dehydrogenase/malonic semialdehyde reductase